MTTLLLFLLFSFSLFSSPAYEKDPLVMVEGCVHAITGDLVISHDDPEGFPIHRVYNSKDGKWALVPHAHLVLYGQKEKDKDKDKKKKKKKDKDKEKYTYDLVKLCEPNGCLVTYHRTTNDQFALKLPTGFTNTARGEIGARNDLKNQKMVQNDTFTFNVTTPNGTKRIYKKAYAVDHDLHFLLLQEELPSGKIYQFEYDQLHRIHTIRCGGNTCRWQRINQSDLDLEWTTGEKISYRYSMQKDASQLKRVSHNESEENFDYTNSRLTKWKRFDGKILLIEYTHEGKVAALKSQEGALLHSFIYFPQKTEVVHSNGSKTIYTYSPSLCPEKIESASEKLQLQWSEDGKILSKILMDTENNILLAQKYTYDDFGNPIKETSNEETIEREFDLLNRITKVKGKEVTELEYLNNTGLISAKIIKNGESTLRTFYEFGPKNELTKVIIDDGPDATYKRVIEIEGGPIHPTSVTEKADSTLLKKTVYYYEEEGITEEIYDADGSLCLKRATSCSGIHKPWEETIPIGVSHEGGYEIKRDYFGRVIAKKLYDAQGMLLEEETWTYNALYLLSHKDKTGLITDYSYNREGRKVREVLHSSRGDIEKTFSYDVQGRLEKIQDGGLITYFRYNEKDQVVEKWEEDLDENRLQKLSYSYTNEGIVVTHFTSHGHATYPLKPTASPPPFKELPEIQYTKDAAGRLIDVKSKDQTIHYSIQYNKRSQPILIVDHANGTSGRRIYDDLGNLIEETLLNGQTIKSDYDLRGRKLQLTLPDDSQVFYTWGAKFLQEVYRITRRAQYEYRHRFLSYDLAGFPTKQRLIEGFGELSFEIDNDLCISAVNSRHLQERAEDLLPEEFETAQQEYTYTCDPLNRPVLFEQAKRKIYYTYDAWNRRMSKRVRELQDGEWVETLHVHFIYDGEKEIGTMDVEEGWLRQLRVLAPHPINPGDNAIAYELEGMPYVPLHDLNGNVKKLLSVIRRKVMETYTFSYSGKEKIADYWGDSIPISKANNPWRFGSHWIDEETGLIYINGDYYDPSRKTFIGDRYNFLERLHLFQLPH